MQQLINQLIEQKSLDFSQAESLFSAVMQGQVSEIELTAALIALKIKGESAAEIAGAASAMRNNAVAFNNPYDNALDACGTGGDGANTINVSTTAALVGASMGLKMVKHGNRSVSSKSGSSDLLAALGINITMPVALAEQSLQQTNFAFLFAPTYHAGVKYAMPVRTQLKTRTIFNILGPLANPAKPKQQLLGVYCPSLLEPMANTLALLGCEKALVVHGAGTDEIALHGETQVVELNNGKLTHYTLSPADFGVSEYPLSDLEGGDANENAAYTLAILKGEGTASHNAAVAVNVAALLVLNNQYPDFKSATEAALTHLSSGAPYQHLQKIVEVSNG
jgi:anthranilate phosphoribosyltransferase